MYLKLLVVYSAARTKAKAHSVAQFLVALQLSVARVVLNMVNVMISIQQHAMSSMACTKATLFLVLTIPV
jgi:hypothetical protein